MYVASIEAESMAVAALHSQFTKFISVNPIDLPCAQILGELFTAEAKVNPQDNVGTWSVTNQRKHSIMPKLVDVSASVDTNNQLDCSGGGRQVYIEHMSSTFDPCLTNWRLEGNSEYRLDYCWTR